MQWPTYGAGTADTLNRDKVDFWYFVYPVQNDPSQGVALASPILLNDAQGHG